MAPTAARERLCDPDLWEGTKHSPLFAQQEEASPSFMMLRGGQQAQGS